MLSWFDGYGVALALEAVGAGGFVWLLWKMADRRIARKEGENA